MTRRPRCNHSAAFKAKVALAAIHGEKTFAEWKNQLLEHAAEVFSERRRVEPAVDVKALHAKIGQLALETDFLESALGKAGLLSARR